MSEGSRSYHAWLEFGKDFLSGKGIADADYDAWLLMEYAANINRIFYSLHMREDMDASSADQYLELLKKRAERIPVQYIIGEAWFMGSSFKVSPSVLIPRLDTEILVEEAAKRLAPGQRVLDMCTGSGCILLTLLKERSVTGVGADLSEDALAIARENQQRLKIRDSQVNWVQGDLFENIGGTFDMIVSNPPYIQTRVCNELEPEVKDHEPWMALDGLEDGLYFEKKIAEIARMYMNPGAWLLMEMGYDQGNAMRDHLKAMGYADVEIIKDLAGNDRVALGRLV